MQNLSFAKIAKLLSLSGPTRVRDFAFLLASLMFLCVGVLLQTATKQPQEDTKRRREQQEEAIKRKQNNKNKARKQTRSNLVSHSTRQNHQNKLHEQLARKNQINQIRYNKLSNLLKQAITNKNSICRKHQHDKQQQQQQQRQQQQQQQR